MFTIMKSIRRLVLIAFLPMGCLCAQTCEKRIGDLITQEDWIGLDKEYSLKKDSIKAPGVRLMAKSLLDVYFNRPDEAINSIDTLLTKYGNEIGLRNAVGMFRYRISQMAVQRRYSMIIYALDEFLKRFSNRLSPNDLTDFCNMQKYFQPLCALKSLKIVRGNHDVEIPFGMMGMNYAITDEEKKTEYYDASIGLLKVKIHDEEYVFLLDTGSEISCIFRNTAEKLELTYLQDSVNMFGVKTVQGKIAMLDSLSLGGLSVYNLMVTVGDNPLAERESSLVKKEDIEKHLHGILGLDVIRRLGEMQIYPHDRRIVIPIEETPLPATGHNLFVNANNNLIIRAYNESYPITFYFDTGNTDSGMFKPYYLKNKTEIDGRFKKMNGFNFGMGGSKTNTIYLIPSFNLTIGSTSFSLNNLSIHTQDVFAREPPTDGTLGMDFILNFNKVTLNMNKMFIVLEK